MDINSVLGKIPVDTIAWVSATFVLLRGVQVGLMKIAELTSNTMDNKIAYYLGKVVDLGTKLIDLLMGNAKH